MLEIDYQYLYSLGKTLFFKVKSFMKDVLKQKDLWVSRQNEPTDQKIAFPCVDLITRV